MLTKEKRVFIFLCIIMWFVNGSLFSLAYSEDTVVKPPEWWEVEIGKQESRKKAEEWQKIKEREEIKEREQEIKKQEQMARQKWKEFLRQCLDNAYSQYQQEWDDVCIRNGRPANCLLPKEAARFLDNRYERNKNHCYKLYDRYW